MKLGAGSVLRCRLHRLYWPYQLAFALAQVGSALCVAALLVRAPSFGHALGSLSPPLLALASLMVRGPIEKVGLVIEPERLIVAGRRVPFAEIVRAVHTYSARDVHSDDGSRWTMHEWVLSLELLVGRIELHRTSRAVPIGDTAPPLRDPYGKFMARAIRRAGRAWYSSLMPLSLADVRADLMEFRRYGPTQPRWQTAMATQAFSLLALALAGIVGFAFLMWQAPTTSERTKGAVPMLENRAPEVGTPTGESRADGRTKPLPRCGERASDASSPALRAQASW